MAQIIDGMDGQVARRTGRGTANGAFLDSFLDRYVDFALLFGLLLHALRFSLGTVVGGFVIGSGTVVVVAALAAAGSSQVSYATARAGSLGIAFARPELVGKGTRTAVIVLCGFLTPLWLHAPLAALFFLAVLTNVAGVRALLGLNRRE